MNSVRKIIQPIKKKWVYHFIVSPRTSLIEKPEWYLNQTLKWIHEHIDSIEVKVNESSEAKRTEIRHMFILCMLELVKMRLNKDLKLIASCIEEEPQYEAILIHTYNEVIVFIKIIRQLLGEKYSKMDEKYDIMGEFAEQKLFEKIIDVEWDYSKRNFKEIISNENKWDPILDGAYVDHYKVPRCADRFLIQIRSISERVECFRQPDCQFQLIDMQCSLFSKFLNFMKQSTDSSPISKNLISDFLFLSEESTIDLSKILRVLNGINFLRLILKEKCFIADDIKDDLDKKLSERLNKVTQEYKTFFNRLIDKVVNISEFADCELADFFEFIKPKLSNDIFEIIRDETSKYHQTRHSQSLLKGL